MQDDLLIRSAVESDAGKILELLKLSLGEGTIPRDERYWSWKHQKNPFGVSPALVAEDHGRLVGLRVFMRWSWARGKDEVHAVRAVDTATHPDWQGRRIFTRLTLALVKQMEGEGISFVFNTPNRFSMPGYLKMGWSSVGKATLWIFPNRPLNLVRTVVSRKDPRGVKVKGTGNRLGGDFPVQDQIERPELDRLLQARIMGDRRLITQLSGSYLRWRYVDIPEFEYRAVGSWSESEEALIIFRLRPRNGLIELRLCEVLSGPGRRSIRRARGLIHEVIDAIRPDFTVAMAASGTPERHVLMGAGFLPAPRVGPILTIRPLAGNDDNDLLDWSGWRTSIGDLELF